MEGGCRCDAVRFRVTRDPLMTTACHCRGCQRMSSSAFSLTGIFPSEGFEITKGEPVLGGLRGPDSHHFFCPECMTWLFTRPERLPHILNVRATLLDDATWFAPFMETFTRTKLPWAHTGALRSFTEFPAPDAYEGLIKELAALGGEWHAS